MPVVVDAGEVVFRVHEVAREAFVILKGVVEIKTGNSAETQDKDGIAGRVFETNAIFGEEVLQFYTGA